MENLSAVSALVVSQKKEWGEIATGFETRNRYTVSDGSGNTLYVAAEEPRFNDAASVPESAAAIHHCCSEQ